MKEYFVDCGGEKWCYKTFGKNTNPSFLILHGWGGSSQSWIQVAQKLSESGFYVIVPDIPGFGKTTLSTEYTLDKYAEIVENFIDTLGLNDFVLLGHSNGGRIAIQMQLRANILPKKLILNNSAGIENPLGTKQKIVKKGVKIAKYFQKIPFFSFFRGKIYRFIGAHDYLNAQNPLLKKTFLHMISSHFSDNEFKKIQKNTFLIWGENDTYTPLGNGEKMHDLIPESTLKILQNQKHGIHLQSPQLLVSTLLYHLK